MTPEGWREDALGQVVDPERRVTYGIVQPGPRQETGVPIIRGKDYSSGRVRDDDLYRVLPEIAEKYSRSVVRGGDILLSIVGYLGLVALVPDHLAGANITQTTARIAIDRVHSPEFFFQFFQSQRFKKEVDRFTKGSAQAGLNLRDVEKMRVLVPPFGEQRKIAAILSSVDDAIEATQAVIDQLQVVKKAMMAELLTRGLPGRHTRFKMTEIGEVPEDWEVVPAEQACTAVIDCKNRTPPYTDSGFPVIRTPNVRNGRLVTNDLRMTDETSYREWTARGEPRAGDLVITREAPVGEVCLIPEGMRACLGQRMMLMRPDRSRLSPEFLVVALQGEGVRARLDLISGGSTVGHVRVGDIRSFPLPIPPSGEQFAIAEAVESVARRIAAEGAALGAAKDVKAALMSVLLSGEVRVKPDEEAA